MPWYAFIWNEEIIEHLTEHDITPDDFENVVMQSEEVEESRSSGRSAVRGYLPDGRYVFAVYELLEDGMTVIPVTCYEIDD